MKVHIMLQIYSDKYWIIQRNILTFYLFLIKLRGIRGCIQKVSGLAAWRENCKWYSFFAIRCSCVAILWVSLVSFASITLFVASRRVFIVISLSTQSGNSWIHPRRCEVCASPQRWVPTTRYEKRYWNTRNIDDISERPHIERARLYR
jgi:hypothetical protein